MDSLQYKSAGISLLVGCFLMIVTMVLHPVGGDFDQLIAILSIGRISHVIALLSLPFVAFGFWGLTEKLGNTVLARLSFLFMIFGLVAVMLAATVNGLILMDFVESYKGISGAEIATLKPIFRLIRSFNHAFDFIFIGAVCISTGLWSLAIIWKKTMTSYLGWFGMVISLVALISLFVGFVFVDLHGFRVFIFGWVAWVLGVGYSLIKYKTSKASS